MTVSGTGRFVVGTRGSALARWQTDHVTDALTKAHAVAKLKPQVAVKVITTQGDVSLAERLVGQIEKGFFTAELEAALRDREIDWAVHSLKDLPTRLPDDLDIAAVLPRHRPNDLLLVRNEAFNTSISPSARPSRLPVKKGARIGTSSLRRDAQLRTFAPECISEPLRGNVPTRLQKLRDAKYDAIVLAGAGVLRLGLDLSGLRVLELDAMRWQPAPGQGAVAVECRKGDAEVMPLFAPIDDAPSRVSAELERRFLRVLEGGCSTPFGAHVQLPSEPARGGRVSLGRAASDGTWRTIHVELPSAASAIDDAFITDALARLASASKESTNDDDTLLWRPL